MARARPVEGVSSGLSWFFAAVLAIAAMTLVQDSRAQSVGAGAALWTGQFCDACHGATPALPQRNAGSESLANSGRSVLDRAIAINAGGAMGGFSGLTATERDSLALYIGSVYSHSQATSVNFGASTVVNLANVSTTTSASASTVITALSTVSGPSFGSLGAYSASARTVTYTHGGANCNADSFTWRGTGTSSNTSTRTVNITVNPPAAPTVSNSTSNIAYSTSPTGLTLNIGGTTATGITITTPLSPSVGSLNVSGTSVTYTASSTQYAPSLTFSYRATAPCGVQSPTTATVTINVSAPPTPVITSANNATATGGQPFFFQVTASNIPTSFGVTGTLPTGITFNTANGQFSGTPTQAGSFPLTVSATNSSGTGNQAFTLNVNFATPVITSSTTASGTGDLPFSYQITATNLPQSYGVTGTLPAGVTLDTSTGLISGTPTQSGTFPVTVSATNPAGTGTRGLTITIAPGTPVITSANSASGQTGQPFSYQITATYSPTSFGATGLPPGVTVNTSTGLISGSPTATGTFNANVTATNATGTGNLNVTITITLGPPVITSPNSAVGGVGNPMSYQITATQNPTSFNATGLPPGLSVNTSTGLISGTPTSGGTFNATVSATNAAGTGNLAVTFTISVLAPVITSPNSASGQTFVPMTYQITAANGPITYGATGLPPGLTVNTNTGLISGSPTATGVFNATVSATNGAGTGSQGVTFTITLGPPVITSPTTANGAVGIAFNYQITAQNSPTSFGATGLPPGLTVNTATGLISGTPTTSGTFNGTVSATNATGTGSQAVTFNIAVGAPVITSANTASGQSGQPFSYQITATNSPTSFGASGLPPGVTVNTTTGLISGSPTATGTFNATVTATNATGTGSLAVTITITLGPPAVTSASTANGATGVAFSYQITATNSPTSFNASGLPPGLTVNTSTGLISGTPTTSGTFNATVSATNSVGTGSQAVTFTIVVGPPVITSAGSASAQTQVPFTYTITATNSPTSFAATGLPIGLTVNPATGLISGEPGATGTFNATISATNAAGTGSRPLVITVTFGPPGITSEPTASGTVGQPFSYNIRATNNPTSFGASGLPPGLSVNTGNGVISGTPTQPGTFTVTISASNATSTVSRTITITIGAVAPTAADLAVTAIFNTPLTITLPASGFFTQVNIVTPPAHGTLSAIPPGSTTVVYTPAAGYSGPDSFTYTVTGPGGTSNPATVAITIGGLAPTAAALAMTVTINSALTVDLRPFISGSGITGIAIATPPAHGTAAVNGTRVTYTPQPGFFGTDSFTYIAFGNAGTSPPALVSVNVVGRTDPTRDANVIGVVSAQTDAAQRFARGQIGNFQHRLESLHTRAPEPATAGARPVPDRAALHVAAADTAVLAGLAPGTTASLAGPLAGSFLSLAASQSLPLAGSAALAGGVNVWIAGNLRFGHRDPVSGSQRIRFETEGVSAGVDRRFGERLALGVGVGFARDKTDIGIDGTKTDTDGSAVAVYGSFQPGPRTFIDALLGYASLDFDNDRFVGLTRDFARSQRKGEQWFASLSAGYEHRHEGLLLSPYARLDYASTRLKQSVESGAGLNALVYFGQTVPMFHGTLGLRAESQHETRFGAIRPRARVELSHDFENAREAVVAYADEFGTRYTMTPAGVRRNALLLGIGSDFLLGGGLRIGLDYHARRASRSDMDQGVRLQLTQELGAKGVPAWFGSSTMFVDPVRVEAGYVHDDNVTRARDARDKLADHIFSVNVHKGRVFPLGSNLRVVGSLFAGAEELYRYTGLGRVSAGAQAELQYRSSGDFDAITFGLQGRIAGDYYDSPIRRGHRYSIALSARRSLTDRIEAFAALTGSARYGKSAVFDLKDYGAKFNLDYSFGGPNGSVYVAGEYRRGDAISSGRFSLENIDIAEAFTPDDAFPPGFFTYRFEAKTWLGTIGYNRPLGPRDAIDVSWRRVQTTPIDRPVWNVPGSSRYIDNQYSIIYLLRF